MWAILVRLGMSAETLCNWVRRAEIDEGQVDGISTAQSRELGELRKKNRELELTIEVLEAATSFFAWESDPRHADLRVRRRASSPVRGRCDLLRAV